MEEPHFVVPQDEFKKYSQIATQYKSTIQTHNDRLKLLYKQQTETYLVAPSEEQLRWANSELQKQNSKNQAIARRMLAEQSEIVKLKRQEEENNKKLDNLFTLEAALFEWAERTVVEASQNRGQLKNTAEWGFAVTILDFLNNNVNNRDLSSRCSLTVEFVSNLLPDAKRFGVRSVDAIDYHFDAMKNVPRRSPSSEKYENARDRTVQFSYDFMDTKARISHSRTKSAAWIKKNLHSDTNGNFTRKQLVLLFALYMGINHIESQLSMELENKLIHALGRTDLLDAHQNHNDRAGRLSFERKKKDFIAQELLKALKDMLSTPTKNSGRVEYIPDANITDASLELLISLSSCVSKLETSYSYKKNGPHVDNTLSILDQTYDRMYQRKGADFKGIADLIGKGKDKVDLPGSVKTLLRDKDPIYLGGRYGRAQGPGGVGR